MALIAGFRGRKATLNQAFVSACPQICQPTSEDIKQHNWTVLGLQKRKRLRDRKVEDASVGLVSTRTVRTVCRFGIKPGRDYPPGRYSSRIGLVGYTRVVSIGPFPYVWLFSSIFRSFHFSSYYFV